MSEMIERVARAIFKVSAPYRDGCCLHNPDFDKCPCSEDAVEQSRAAILAMRDPDEDFVWDAAYKLEPMLRCIGNHDLGSDEALKIFNAVIDAALD